MAGSGKYQVERPFMMETIQIWNRCNNRCIMCTNPLWLDREPVSAYSMERFSSRLLTLKRTELSGGLHISGGEPTLHPDFFNILRSIRTKFPTQKLYLLTNGRMFSYKAFIDRVLEFDTLFLQIPIFGHTARLHDRITGVRGSFDQTVSGVRNILKRRNRKQFLEIRTVLVKQNLSLLPNIVEFSHAKFKGIDTFVIIFPEPEGRCEADFNNVGITYSQARKTVHEVVRMWKRSFRDLRLYHFPLCTIDPELWPFAWITQDPNETTYVGMCRECRYKKYCARIHQNYLPLAGEKEFIRPARRGKVRLNNGVIRKYHPIKEVV